MRERIRELEHPSDHHRNSGKSWAWVSDSRSIGPLSNRSYAQHHDPTTEQAGPEWSRSRPCEIVPLNQAVDALGGFPIDEEGGIFLIFLIHSAAFVRPLPLNQAVDAPLSLVGRCSGGSSIDEGGIFLIGRPSLRIKCLQKRPNPSKVGPVLALSWVKCDVSFGRTCTPAAPGRQYSFLSSHGT
jgi:hypothetical protein